MCHPALVGLDIDGHSGERQAAIGKVIMQSELTGLRSPEELATDLGMSVRTIYRLTAAGQLPVYRAGRLLRYSLDEVLRHMRTKGTSQ